MNTIESLAARVSAQDTLIRDLSEQLARLRADQPSTLLQRDRPLIRHAEEVDSLQLWRLREARAKAELADLKFDAAREALLAKQQRAEGESP